MIKREQSEKTKSDIIKVASRLFLEKGWDKTKLLDILREVGVTSGAFYHYFESREDLIYAVTVQMLMDNNYFDIAEKKKELNGIEKLRYAMNLSLKHQLNNDLENDIKKAMHEPLVFKSNVFFSINVLSPYIERLITEGNNDGSMSVQYPKHMAHTIVLLYNEWLNPAIFKMSEQEFTERILFLKQLGEQQGVDIVDDELKEMLLKYRNISL